MRRFEFPIGQVRDSAAQECFAAIADEITSTPFGGFRGRFVDWTLPEGTHVIPHGLTLLPKDVIQTHVSCDFGASGAVTWNYADFTKTHVSLTVTVLPAGNDVRVRAFVGLYQEK
jgi:hypothetical protein